MSGRKRYSLPSGATALNLEKLVGADRSLLFSIMPRMIDGEGTVTGSLHLIHHLEQVQGETEPVSENRWNSALRRSRTQRHLRRETIERGTR